MTKPSIEQLEKQIEHLVAEHLAAVRAAARAAVDRAGGTTPRSPRSARRSRPRSGSGRRTAEEIAVLGDRLYEAVVAHPVS